MPYINQERRAQLADCGDYPSSAGELNYMLTMEVKRYWATYGPTLGYRAINDIIGALEGAKLEFYRRVAVPYEDTKIEQNGDVYLERLSPANQEIYDGIYGK